MPELKRLTMADVMARMRNLGLHISPETLKAGMESGVFGFGKIIRKDGRKNCTVIILESDFNRWVAEKAVER